MATQMPQNELIVGRWYVGRGRNANVGLWNGSVFLTIAEKFGEDVIKSEPYYTDKTGTFQPFALIDEGEVVESIGRQTIWDRHYARQMEFGRKQSAR